VTHVTSYQGTNILEPNRRTDFYGNGTNEKFRLSSGDGFNNPHDLVLGYMLESLQSHKNVSPLHVGKNVGGRFLYNAEIRIASIPRLRYFHEKGIDFDTRIVNVEPLIEY